MVYFRRSQDGVVNIGEIGGHTPDDAHSMHAIAFEQETRGLPHVTHVFRATRQIEGQRFSAASRLETNTSSAKENKGQIGVSASALFHLRVCIHHRTSRTFDSPVIEHRARVLAPVADRLRPSPEARSHRQKRRRRERNPARAVPPKPETPPRGIAFGGGHPYKSVACSSLGTQSRC